MKPFLAAAALVALTLQTRAQAILPAPVKSMDLGKCEITCLATGPKGERILISTTKGAELWDLDKGKRLQRFDFQEDGETAVWYCAFNDNGEYVVLIGFTGRREVWDLKSGKQDRSLGRYGWIPDAVRTREMGLKLGNSNFDTYYRQTQATSGSLTAHADKGGSVVFTDADGNAVQTLTFPENKDKQHLAPCLFDNGQFITGTDDGRVLFYALAKQ